MPRSSRVWDDAAREYDAVVVTPFAAGVDFPLGHDVRRVLGRWRRDGGTARRVAVDFGCGRGDALPLLAGRAGLTLGLDFSTPMLELAAARLRAAGMPARRLSQPALVASALRTARRRTGTPVTALVRGDMRNLSWLRGAVDLALAITSISAPTTATSLRMFSEVSASLRPSGTLIAVLASLDALDYLSDLAARLGHPLPHRGRLEGDIFVENGERQKFFAPAEIRACCAAAGLAVERLEKLRYPWRLMDRFGWGYFPRYPRLWDWYLVAHARSTSRRAGRSRRSRPPACPPAPPRLSPSRCRRRPTPRVPRSRRSTGRRCGRH